MTLCAWRRECLFGEVVEGFNKLSTLGQILYEEWLRSSVICKEIQLYDDEFIIMPNHLHAIVWIIAIVGADGIRPEIADSTYLDPAGGAKDEGARRGPLPKSLGAFIAGFKSSVTSRAQRELIMMAIWQRNYYEHIIRNGVELRRIYDYVQYNPARWEQDQLHPAALPNPFNREKDQPGK